MRLNVLKITAGFLLCLGAAQAQQSMPPSKYYQWGLNTLTSGRPRVYDKDALNDFRFAAEGGYAPAEVMLGYVYETGLSVPKDPAVAMQWYRKSADQDNQLAEWLLGRLYYTGNGTDQNLDEASKWFEKSASHGDPIAEYLLGKVDLDRKNYEAAAKLFRKAATRGSSQAAFQLAMLLKSGQGVAADNSEAYSWLIVSSDTGYKPATDQLAALAPQVGAQLEEAKTKGRELERSASQAASQRGCTGWEGELDDIPAPPPPLTQMACQ
jgi:TPR repeat protein